MRRPTGYGAKGFWSRTRVVLVDRQQGGKQALRKAGINLTSLLTLQVILNYLMSSGKINEEWYRRSLEYLEASPPR